MNWKQTQLSEFLIERDGRIKYEIANQLGLQRIKKIDFSGNIHLDAETDTKTDMIRVKSGDLVISGINAAKGAIAVHAEDDDVLATIHYSAYEFNSDRISVDFLKWFFKSPEFSDLLKKQIPGGIKTELKPKHILPLQVKLPTLAEQMAVAARLDRFRLEQIKLEHEITHQQSLLAKLKQAILQEAIQGKLTVDWRAANRDVEPASQLLHRIQAKKASLITAKKLRPEKPLHKITPAEIPFEIPKGWEWCRASNIGFVIGGLTKNAAKRGGHKRLLPYLRVANVYANRLDLSDLQEIGVADSEVEKLLLEKDDLLVVEGNGSRDQVGRIARWDGSVDPCVHQNHVIKVRLGEPKVALWALYWFLSPSGRVLIEEQARTSTGLYNLSTGKVANLPIPLPPLAEQAAIVERVEALMTTFRVLEAEIEQARTHAAHLLHAVLEEAFSPASA
jgi:type I restriction enzyme S subunit